MKNPRFCIIAPAPYLQTYAPRSTAHLVLAHIVKNDPEYALFYKRMKARGDLVIMDNSAFEIGQSYEPDELIELGKKCGAEYLVLPDYPFVVADDTIQAAIKYIPVFKDAGFKTMFVPQSKKDDLDDWVSAYEWGAYHPDIDIVGMSILGIPNALSHIPPAYARVVMTQLLVDRGMFNFDKHHHYLGLNAGPALEIPPLIKMGVLDTLDSSAPVWQGLLGVEYNKNCDSYAPVKKIHFPVQFNYQLTTDKDTHRRIDNNLNLTLELFGQYDARSEVSTDDDEE